MKRTYPRSRGLALSATLAALISICALISIPLPFTPVPVTLQVLGVYLAASLLGPIYGALSCLIYVMLGAVGLPVFAGATSGVGVLLGPLGGYLVSCPVAALAAGSISRSRSVTRRRDATRVFVSCLVSMAVIYAIGVTWLALYLHIGLYAATLLGLVPFVPLDALKALVAVPIACGGHWRGEE